MKKIELKNKKDAYKVFSLCEAGYINQRQGARFLGLNRETFRDKYRIYLNEKAKQTERIGIEEELF